jgi:hypothetical protein
MLEPKTFGRREFTVASVLAMLSGVTITVCSCGGGSGSPSTPSGPNPTPAPTPAPDPGGGDKVGSISANHGHAAIVTAAELTAAQGFSLDIRGTADHTHTVILSSADLVAIAANQLVSKASSSDAAHSHTVTFN